MPYLNVVGSFPFHPKTIQAGNAAIGLWTRAGAWSAENEQDGYVPAEIAKALGSPREIKALLNAGYWEPALVGGGYIMHDYDQHNITAAEARLLSEKRAKAGRKGGSAPRRPGLRAIKDEANG